MAGGNQVELRFAFLITETNTLPCRISQGTTRLRAKLIRPENTNSQNSAKTQKPNFFGYPTFIERY